MMRTISMAWLRYAWRGLLLAVCLVMAVWPDISARAQARGETMDAPAAPMPLRPCLIQGHYRACVGVELADAQAEQQAKAWEAPPPGQAYVYVLRPHGQQSRQPAQVSLGGKAVALLGPMTFTRVPVSAGMHELVVRTDSEIRIPLEVIAGQVLVLEYELVVSFGLTRPELRPLDASQASMLQALGLVQSLAVSPALR